MRNELTCISKAMFNVSIMTLVLAQMQLVYAAHKQCEDKVAGSVLHTMLSPAVNLQHGPYTYARLSVGNYIQ